MLPSLVPLPRKNTFLMTLIGLCFLCFALSEARADVKGIPFSDQFASAAFPYARTVAGCTEWRRPDRFGDEWGPVSFAGACQEHDRCFHTQGANWSDCNQRFRADLEAACERDLGRERLEKGRASKPDPQALKLCYEIVGLYQAKVQDRDVVRRFDLAQKQADLYMKYVRGVVNDVFRAVLKRSASSKEQDQALKTLTDDYSLDDLKAALMGQRLDESSQDGSQEISASDGPMPVIDTAAQAVQTLAEPEITQ